MSLEISLVSFSLTILIRQKDEFNNYFNVAYNSRIALRNRSLRSRSLSQLWYYHSQSLKRTALSHHSRAACVPDRHLRKYIKQCKWRAKHG